MNTQEAEVALAEELRRIAPDVDVAAIDRNGDLREEFDIDSNASGCFLFLVFWFPNWLLPSGRKEVVVMSREQLRKLTSLSSCAG